MEKPPVGTAYTYIVDNKGGSQEKLILRKKMMKNSLNNLFELAYTSLEHFCSKLNEVNKAGVIDRIISDEEEFKTPLHIYIHILEAMNIYSRYLSDLLSISNYMDEFIINSLVDAEQIKSLIILNLNSIKNRLLILEDKELEDLKIYPKWGGEYDLEMFLEHIIVHNLRHELQLKKNLIQLAV